MKNLLISAFLAFFATGIAQAQGESTPAQILFTNVNVFDGVNDSLKMNQDVLVEGNADEAAARLLFDTALFACRGSVWKGLRDVSHSASVRLTRGSRAGSRGVRGRARLEPGRTPTERTPPLHELEQK